jgi:hypothetical protein
MTRVDIGEGHIGWLQNTQVYLTKNLSGGVRYHTGVGTVTKHDRTPAGHNIVELHFDDTDEARSLAARLRAGQGVTATVDPHVGRLSFTIEDKPDPFGPLPPRPKVNLDPIPLPRPR